MTPAPENPPAFPRYYLVFDVESIGLHGEGFAVGWVVVGANGAEYESGMVACDPSEAKGTDADRDWCAKNLPRLAAICHSPKAVRSWFWKVWQVWKRNGAVLVSDCGWPVEARFLAQCVDDDQSRHWEGPYPLHDLASVLLARGLDPLAKRERLLEELPEHDPHSDARQSARLLIEALAARTQPKPTP